MYCLQYLWLLVYSGVKYILCCLIFVLFVFVYQMLPVSLDCPFLTAPSVFSNVYLSCVPYVASFSGLPIFDCPFGILWRLFILCTLCSQFLWIAHFWLPLRYPMLPVSLDCPFLTAPSVFSNVYLSCVPYVASFSGLPIFDCPFGFL
jgi:hypothetical protein